MKHSFFALALAFFAPLALANTKTLECSSGVPYERFKATLDFGDFREGSASFRVKNASFIDNYTGGELVCIGHQLKDVACVGFINLQGDNVAKIDVVESNGQFVAQTRQIAGEIILANSSWPCTVK